MCNDGRERERDEKNKRNNLWTKTSVNFRYEVNELFVSSFFYILSFYLSIY